MLTFYGVMTMLSSQRMGLGSLVLAAVLGIGEGGAAQAAPEPSVPRPKPVHVFAQAGTGLTELGHAEAGVFLFSRLTLEAMVAWEGVYGSRYGGGLMYAFGHVQDGRPPRHALLVGARVMLNAPASFDSHGDDLSSYALVPVGYGYLADSGFYLRATIAPVIARQRRDQPQPSGEGQTTVGHEWTAGLGMINFAVGFAL